MLKLRSCDFVPQWKKKSRLQGGEMSARGVPTLGLLLPRQDDRMPGCQGDRMAR